MRDTVTEQFCVWQGQCVCSCTAAAGLAVLLPYRTASQVCNLAWSKNVNEIVSTHGYSQNQICVWKYPAMAKLATLTGHTLRWVRALHAPYMLSTAPLYSVVFWGELRCALCSLETGWRCGLMPLASLPASRA